MNIDQAVGCGTPIAFPSATLDTPPWAMHHTATNHLSSPSGLSSKIVPTLQLNCLRQSLALHWSIDRDAMTPTASPLHFGQAILPSGHLAASMARNVTAGSAK